MPFRPPLPPKIHKIPDDERVKQVFKDDERAGIIGGFPVADGARGVVHFEWQDAILRLTILASSSLLEARQKALLGAELYE